MANVTNVPIIINDPRIQQPIVGSRPANVGLQLPIETIVPRPVVNVPQNIVVGQQVQANPAQPSVHPRTNIGLPIEIQPEEETNIPMTDEAISTQVPNIPASVPATKDQYIPQTICGIPTLPANSTTQFSGDLAIAISSFRDTTKSIKARASSQSLVERYLVERGSCSRLNPGITNDLRLRLFSIDDVRLDQILSTADGMNANFHDDIACAVDAIIYDGKMPGQFSPNMRERVRNWFPTIRQIGAESVEGYALKASFSDASNIFILKAPRNPNNDELVHEAAVGFYGLNKLRHILPNYMYVYGYMKCSPPALNNKEAVTWCSSSNPAVSYLISENIRDAVPMSDFITDPNTTGIDFLVVFLQLFNALNLAYKFYGYTHYDLHAGNVMIRKYAKIVAIPYFGTSNKVIGYIASQYVPYLIDYGYSRISIGGVGFGKIGLEAYGIEGETPFPMFDIYKILAFTAQQLYTKPKTSHFNDINGLLEKLFSFFNEGPIRDRVTRRLNNSGDYYSARSTYRNITHDEYLTWLQTQSGLNLPVHINILPLLAKGVLSAPINTAVDTCRFYNIVTSEAGPETSLEYCEVVAALNADSVLSPDAKQSALTWLNNRFDAAQYLRTTAPSVNAKISEAQTLLTTNLVVDKNIIPKLSQTANLLSASFVTTYRNHILALLRIKDIASDSSSYIRAAVCSLATQGTFQTYRTGLDVLGKTVTDMIQYINSQKAILTNNVTYAQSLKSSSISDQAVSNFWNTEHENLVLAV